MRSIGPREAQHPRRRLRTCDKSVEGVNRPNAATNDTANYMCKTDSSPLPSQSLDGGRKVFWRHVEIYTADARSLSATTAPTAESAAMHIHAGAGSLIPMKVSALKAASTCDKHGEGKEGKHALESCA